ncbi:spermidine synthase [Allostreptomyces psammosilenae]|uniref:Spermidine synthase n=1 Tax=Allostreptomyces psammosilenae TaxID=1892865 RepID=A0A853A150_9ACTN|nr:fused MFS/spermidine synthase [Allostreptomyces psammosilenae]NYI08286.1 spermidine synthase [Allostreptomyces psammosilenae]
MARGRQRNGRRDGRTGGRAGGSAAAPPGAPGAPGEPSGDGPAGGHPVDSGTAELRPDRDRPGGVTLLLDGTPQSHVDLDDPTYLEFEYVRRLGHVVDLAAPPGAPLAALHLGGGALTLPRYLAATRPRSGQQVVEIDAALVALVRERLPWDRSWRIRVRQGDAREVLARTPADFSDLVVADVFSGARTPAHLTSVEFVTEVARVLRPSGVYAANVADGAPLAFARSQVATVREVFPEVALIADPGVLRGRRFGNLVLVASLAPLPIADLLRRTAGDPFPGRVESGRALVDFAAGAAPVRDDVAVPSPAPPAGAFG